MDITKLTLKDFLEHKNRLDRNVRSDFSFLDEAVEAVPALKSLIDLMGKYNESKKTKKQKKYLRLMKEDFCLLVTLYSLQRDAERGTPEAGTLSPKDIRRN
jgi:hypothetical protein